MSTTNTGLDWPSREEWAKRRRELHTWPEVSYQTADYMTEEERQQLIHDMRERWKALGREMRAATDHSEREDCRERRQGINRAIKHLKAGELPVTLFHYQGADDLIAPYLARYKAALAEAVKAAEEEAAKTPIDDAAWEEELAERARIEAIRAQQREYLS